RIPCASSARQRCGTRVRRLGLRCAVGAEILPDAGRLVSAHIWAQPGIQARPLRAPGRSRSGRSGASGRAGRTATPGAGCGRLACAHASAEELAKARQAADELARQAREDSAIWEEAALENEATRAALEAQLRDLQAKAETEPDQQQLAIRQAARQAADRMDL